MDNEKKCLVCGQFFTKKINCSKKDWLETKFCSRICSDKKNLFLKGKNPWNKDKQVKQISGQNHWNWQGGKKEKKCLICQKPFFVSKSIISKRKFCSKTCLIEYRSSEKSRKHLSEIHKKRVADGLHNLYRGVSEENELARKSFQYRIWRDAVFKRDDFTCQECGQKGETINADHIKQFAYFPELRFEISNGRTLCEECHHETDTWGLKLDKNLLKV